MFCGLNLAGSFNSPQNKTGVGENMSKSRARARALPAPAAAAIIALVPGVVRPPRPLRGTPLVRASRGKGMGCVMYLKKI